MCFKFANQVLEIGSGPSGKRLCVKDEKGRNCWERGNAGGTTGTSHLDKGKPDWLMLVRILER